MTSYTQYLWKPLLLFCLLTGMLVPAIVPGVPLAAQEPTGESLTLFQPLLETGSLVTLEQKVLAPGDGEDMVASSIALDGDTAVVGAPLDTVGGVEAQGSVYVFTRSGTMWSLQQQLFAGDGVERDRFGMAVALSGDTLLVGAPGWYQNSSSGAVYVFTRSGATWTQQQKLLAADGAAQDSFGSAVALSGETALIGARDDDVGANVDQGSAYVFTRSGGAWSQQAKLTAEDGSADASFGAKVALDGDTALVIAQYADVGGNHYQGAGYVFTRSGMTWTQQDQLVDDGGAEWYQFGCAAALSGDIALMGDCYRDTVLVFMRSGASWIETDRLTVSDAEDSWFGSALALDGNTALIGAMMHDVGANGAQGSAYVFMFDDDTWTWTEEAHLFAFAGVASELFGSAVALQGQTAVIAGEFGEGQGDSHPDVGSAYVFTGSGATWTPQAQLTGTEGETDDRFGRVVALSGDGKTALVGAYMWDWEYYMGLNADQGLVYVFVHNGTNWQLQGRLFDWENGAAGDAFGRAVALSYDGNTALIGAYADDVGANTDQGSAYIFVREGTTWTQQANFTAAGSRAEDWFGLAVALAPDGNTALIGSPADDVGTNADQGSAYIFTRNGTIWTQQTSLVAPDGGEGDSFGYAVALEGNTALIGAAFDDVGSHVDQGSVYVFTRSGTSWSLQQNFTAADGAAGDRFGYAVALSGEIALIGAPVADIGGNEDQGAAYTFTRNGAAWSEEAKLTAADGAISDLFGRAVALDGHVALVGVTLDDVDGNTDAGSARLFTRGGGNWTERGALAAADGATDDWFGVGVALTGDTALVGAFYDDTGAMVDQGSAYFYEIVNVVTLLQEDFDAVTLPGIPPWWAQAKVIGTDGEWSTRAGSWHPAGIPAFSPPNLEVFNSYTAANGASTLLIYNRKLDLRIYAQASLSFWMLHDTGYPSNADNIRVQVSTDGGSAWTTVGPIFYRYDGTSGWRQKTVDLSDYLSHGEVYVAFLATSADGNDCHMDSLRLLAFDSQLPSVGSITRADPNPNGALLLHYNVTFSEPVVGVDKSDFVVTMGGAATGSVMSLSGFGASYVVTVVSNGSDGTLRLDIPAGAGITDATGLPLMGLPYTEGEAYTVDKTPPSVVSITRADPNPTSAASVAFNVLFSEPVTDVNTADFLLTTSGITGASITSVSGSGASYTVVVNTGSGSGTLRLDVSVAAIIRDTAGNGFGGGYTGGQTYTITKAFAVFLPLVLRSTP